MSAFLHAIGTVVAGTFATARMTLSLPKAMDLTGAYGTWELLDLGGRVWTQGDFDSLTVEDSQVAPGNVTASAELQIPVPNTLPANDAGTSYQVRWKLNVPTQPNPIYSFENFTVLPATQNAQGAHDTVELLGDDIGIQLSLPGPYSNVEYECYRGNSKLFGPRAAINRGAVSDGTLYTGVTGPAEVNIASLDPYSIVWSYWNAVSAGSPIKNRESTQLFVVTPIILDAIKDVQNYINRAYTDSGISPGTTFTPTDLVKYLRLGRDMFNAADKPTEFTLTAAAGPIRWFWIGYSCAAACRAQYLAEGMKTFNFSGQTVQLDVDRTQFWESMATSLETQLNEQVKPFKDNLIKKGILGGDGSSMALRQGAVGSIGITRHGLSPLRGPFGTQFTPFLR